MENCKYPFKQGYFTLKTRIPIELWFASDSELDQELDQWEDPEATVAYGTPPEEAKIDHHWLWLSSELSQQTSWHTSWG